MNDSFQVKEIQVNNRGLFSKKSFERNQLVLQCQPIGWATLQTSKTKNCNWCFLEKQLVKCSQCKCFYYCSTQCQKSDWKYHKFECKIFAKMTTQKNLSIYKQISTEFVLNTRLYFVLRQNKDLFEKFYKMCSQDDFQPLQRRQHFQQLAVVMMQNLGIQKNEANMSQLIKQFNIVSVNAFTVQDLFYTTDGIAVAIYWPANYLNHACNSNCTQVFDGRYLKIIGNKHIDPNEELTICYTSPLDLQKNRSKFLKENYLFECFCEMCQVERMINTEFGYIKCPECKEANIRKKTDLVSLQQASDNLTEEKQEQIKDPSLEKKNVKYECSKCKKTIDQEFLTQSAQKIQSLPQRIEKMKSYKEKKQQVLLLKKQVDLKHPSFYKALQAVYLQAINEGLLSDDNQSQKKYFTQGNILLNEIIKNLPQWYKIQEEQLYNIRFFSKFNEMSKLAYNMNKFPKCVEYIEKASKCIEKLQFKHKYKDIDELKRRQQEVSIEMSIAKAKALK